MIHLMEFPDATKTYRPGRWAQVEDPEGVNMLDFVEDASSGLLSPLDPEQDPVTDGILLSSGPLSLASLLLLSSDPLSLTSFLLLSFACSTGNAENLRAREVAPPTVGDEASTSELASTKESIANRFSVGTGSGEGYVEGVPSSLITTSPYRFLWRDGC